VSAVLLCAILLIAAAPARATVYGSPPPPANLLAFQSDRGGSWDIWTVDQDGGGLAKVAASTRRSSEVQPTFAPPDNPNLFATIDVAGTERVLTVRGGGDGIVGVDQVSIDGLAVPFTAKDGFELTAAVPAEVGPTPQCVTVRRRSVLAGATPDLVSADLDPPATGPSTCPDTRGDGRAIVYASDRSGNWDLWGWDPRRPRGPDNPLDLTRTPGVAETAPSWSPGNPAAPDDPAAIAPARSLIAYAAKAAGNTDIYVLDPSRPVAAGGTNPSRVTTSPGAELNPEWAMDGRQLAFETNRSGVREIWTLRLIFDAASARWVGTGEVNLTAGQLPAKDPAWYSFGQGQQAYDQIVFVGPSASADAPDTLGYLEAAPGLDAATGVSPFSDPALSKAYIVDPSPGASQGPAWSPTADALAFGRVKGSRWHIAVLLHGLEPTEAVEVPAMHFATSGKGNDLNPAWRALPYDAQPYARHIYGTTSQRPCKPKNKCKRKG
jgi:hypothetical protein